MRNLNINSASAFTASNEIQFIQYLEEVTEHFKLREKVQKCFFKKKHVYEYFLIQKPLLFRKNTKNLEIKTLEQNAFCSLIKQQSEIKFVLKKKTIAFCEMVMQ